MSPTAPCDPVDCDPSGSSVHVILQARIWSELSFPLGPPDPGIEHSSVTAPALLYILASFVEDKVSVGAWIYLWAFYFVPLIYISVFLPVPYCLDNCGFVVEPEVSITFLPRSKPLLISWLQSPSAVILEPPKIKSDTVSAVSPSISHEVMG